MDIIFGVTEAEGFREILRPAGVSTILVVLFLCIFFIICGMKVKKADPSKPSKGLVLILELIVTFVEGYVSETMGAKNVRFAPYITTVGAFLIVANLVGLIGLTPPTSDFTITLALAAMTIVLMIGSAIKVKGVKGYLRDTFLGTIPWLLPLNIMSEVAKPISLSFRLFGNILSGAIILFIAIDAFGYFTIPVLPFLNAYFDIFAGLMQTMIFCMLTMIWTQNAMALSDE